MTLPEYKQIDRIAFDLSPSRPLPRGAIPMTPDRLRELAVQWQNDARRIYESAEWREASPMFYETARRCFAEWMEATRD